MRHFLLACTFLMTATTALTADDWPRFRGPGGSGLSDCKTIPTQWTDADYHWKITLPGTGVSSPVVWGDKLFITCADETTARHTLICIRTGDGSSAWKSELAGAAHHHHDFNAFASSTPAVDGQRVYYAWTTPEHFNVIAFDHGGKEIWRRDLGPFKAQHGGGVSPIVVGDLLIMANDQDGPSGIFALDSATGQTRWKAPRRSGKASYATPCVYEPKGGKPQIIVSAGSTGVTALDPQSGKVIWEIEDVFKFRTVMSPVVVGGLILAGCGEGGSGKSVVAIAPGEKAGKARVIYELNKGIPYVPMPVAVGKLLFLVTDGGIASCLDAATGEVKWQERLGGTYFSSPICVNGYVYCVSRIGEAVVFRATGEKLDVVGRCALGEGSQATPAVASGRLFLRTTGNLICIGDKSKTVAR